MVTCKVCNKTFRAITRTHLATHQLSYDSYRSLYPGADLGRKQRLLITSEEAAELYQKQRRSLSAIAKLKGVHPDLIKRDLMYLGYEIRGHEDSAQVFDYNASDHELLEALALGIWMGEGTKGGKRLAVTNCDPNILLVWMTFLLQVCNVSPDKLRLRVTIYETSSRDEALQYWHNQLGMSMPCWFGTIKVSPNRTSPIRHPMGTATVYVNSTFLLKRIQLRVVELSKSLM